MNSTVSSPIRFNIACIIITALGCNLEKKKKKLKYLVINKILEREVHTGLITSFHLGFAA